MIKSGPLLSPRSPLPTPLPSHRPSSNPQLKPFLPKLLPKLYRYLYDPSPKVNGAMTAIWKALVPDRARALDEHLNVILAELVRSGSTQTPWAGHELLTMQSGRASFC